MNFVNWYQKKLGENPLLSERSINSVLELAEGGATVPFISRYRKEKTGNLDEVQVQSILDQKENWDELIKRKEFILSEIKKQDKLNPDLKSKIDACFDSLVLEDLYLPYKLKKKTKASLAKEAGLEVFSDWIWNLAHLEKQEPPQAPLHERAKNYLNPEKKLTSEESVLQGAMDIIIEKLAEQASLREETRNTLLKEGSIKTSKGEKAKSPSKFENYFNFCEQISSLMDSKNSHRYLALKRGWKENEISIKITHKTDEESFEEKLISPFEQHAFQKGCPKDIEDFMKKASRLALKAYVLPSVSNDIHKTLKETADKASIQVFCENVRNLLLASPYGAKTVLGVDPGLRSGCKAALVEDSGKYLTHTVFHILTDAEKAQSKKLFVDMFLKIKISAIAVGNGTGGRETEQFLKECVRETALNIPVVMISEAGASVYSASAGAREEFPDLDLTIRGAISIARRLQDPLAELVKVDPKSIGVGQYQHDVNATSLKKSLNFVVESCVNHVGVNLNTASEKLLSHVSGIGPGLAKSIVSFRVKNKLFKSREELLKVSRFSQKTFEQSAGFLRIPGAPNPLDNTGIHPERYEMINEIAQKEKCKIKDLIGSGVKKFTKHAELETQLGEFTFKDIVAELEKPGRDPREEFSQVKFREDIHEVKDLKEGMSCPGVVTNVTNFGAFVDIGVHQDGLVHLSQLADQFVSNANDIVKPGDKVQVRVLSVDSSKNQISLSMRNEETSSKKTAQAQKGRRRPPQQNKRTGGQGPHQKTRGRGHSRKKKEKPIDPNNPFAKLANLKFK